MSNNNVRKVNRSIVPNGTVRGLEIFQDTTDDKLYYKDGNGNVTPLGSSTVSPENTWEIPTVAFVNPDPAVGNDGTAVIGDGNKPYLTIAAAQAASNIIFFQPYNDYTEKFALGTGKTYFSYPGVIFTTGGIVNTGGTLVGTKFLGYAKFFGNQNLIRLDNITLTDVVIEFDSAETTSGASGGCCFIDCDNPSTLTFKCNSLKDIYNGNAFGASFKGPITGTLDVAESIIGSYGVLALGFSGEYLRNFTVNCPRIVCLNGGIAGNLDPYKQAVNYGGTESGYKTVINGNVYHEAVGTLANFSGCVVARYSGGGTLEINGNLVGGDQRGIVNLSTDNIIFNGGIDTVASAFTITTGEILIKNSTILQGIANSITGSPKVFIYGSTIKSTTTANIIDKLSAASKLVIRDTDAVGDTGEFVNTGGGSFAVGMINVFSNLNNDSAMASLYTALGFTKDTALIVPDFN